MGGAIAPDMKSTFKRIRAALRRAVPRSAHSDRDCPDFACVGFPKCATTFILKRFGEYSFDTLVDGEFKSRIQRPGCLTNP